MCREMEERLRENASLLELRAPSSSIETQRFIANGFEVSERISAMTSLMAAGLRPCAPNDPRPPKFETAAVNRWVDRPPSGPWIIGYSMPRRDETRVWFHSDEVFFVDWCSIVPLQNHRFRPAWFYLALVGITTGRRARRRPRTGSRRSHGGLP